VVVIINALAFINVCFFMVELSFVHVGLSKKLHDSIYNVVKVL
jgi:hypothetical protein